MSDRSKKIYAWYSPTAATFQNLIVTYKTFSGDDVTVSTITDNPHESGLLYKDVTFIGEVDHWVSSVSNSNFENNFKKTKTYDKNYAKNT